MEHALVTSREVRATPTAVAMKTAGSKSKLSGSPATTSFAPRTTSAVRSLLNRDALETSTSIRSTLREEWACRTSLSLVTDRTPLRLAWSLIPVLSSAHTRINMMEPFLQNRSISNLARFCRFKSKTKEPETLSTSKPRCLREIATTTSETSSCHRQTCSVFATTTSRLRSF